MQYQNTITNVTLIFLLQLIFLEASVFVLPTTTVQAGGKVATEKSLLSLFLLQMDGVGLLKGEVNYCLKNE